MTMKDKSPDSPLLCSEHDHVWVTEWDNDDFEIRYCEICGELWD